MNILYFALIAPLLVIAMMALAAQTIDRARQRDEKLELYLTKHAHES